MHCTQSCDHRASEVYLEEPIHISKPAQHTGLAMILSGLGAGLGVEQTKGQADQESTLVILFGKENKQMCVVLVEVEVLEPAELFKSWQPQPHREGMNTDFTNSWERHQHLCLCLCTRTHTLTHTHTHSHIIPSVWQLHLYFEFDVFSFCFFPDSETNQTTFSII